MQFYVRVFQHPGPVRLTVLPEIAQQISHRGGFHQLRGTEREAADRPNLLFLSIDTLRADHLSSYGYERMTTPTIDEIASNGMRFAQARAAASIYIPHQF